MEEKDDIQLEEQDENIQFEEQDENIQFEEHEANQKTPKKKRKKGFTLIEILTVIIILGILMIIAIPAVSKYIMGSRNSSYITTVEKYIDSALNEVTGLEYSVSNKNYTYYIPTKCLGTENEVVESPYGDFVKSYVVVTSDGTKQEYYYTGYDDTGHGILLTHRSLLNESVIKTDIKSIDTTIGVGNREYVYIYSDTCNKTGEIQTALSFIPEKGKKSTATSENGTTDPTSQNYTPDPTNPDNTPGPDTPTSTPHNIPTDGQISVRIGDNNSEFQRDGIKMSFYLLAYGDYGDLIAVNQFSDVAFTPNENGNIDVSMNLNQIHSRINDINYRPVAQATTNSNGLVVVNNLMRGVYYVEMISGPEGLTVEPMIIVVPNREGRLQISAVPMYEYYNEPTITPTPTPSPTPSPTPFVTPPVSPTPGPTSTPFVTPPISPPPRN